MVIIAVIVIVLIVVICQRQFVVRRLKRENSRLLQSLQKAEKDLDIKNSFIRGLANDLREPLNPITGFSDLLEVDNLAAEERKTLSQQIKGSSGILAKLIDDLAELSYYENQKRIPLTDSVSPNMLCRHMIDAFSTINKPHVKLMFQTSLPDTFEYKTHLESMERLMTHLIANAVIYTEKGSVIVACSQNENGVRFSVTDTGRGIPDELKESMFELLNRSGAETKLTGMELSICQTITRLLGGRIWLDTKYTSGARFICEFPNSR